MRRISAITSYEDFTRFIGDIVQRIDRAPADADRTPTDRFEIEIRMFRKTLGRIVVTGLRAYGIKLPASRADADRMVTALLDGKPLK